MKKVVIRSGRRAFYQVLGRRLPRGSAIHNCVRHTPAPAIGAGA